MFCVLVLTQRVGERMIGAELVTSVSRRGRWEDITTPHILAIWGIRAIISTTIGTDGREKIISDMMVCWMPSSKDNMI